MRPFLCLAAAILLTACDVQVGERGISLDIAEGRATDEWVRTYTLPAGGTLEIVNVNGAIEATAGEGREVEILAERRVRAGSSEEAQELLKQVEMREDVSPERVRVEARGTWEPRSGGLRRGPQLTVAYRVRVPAGVDVSLTTENGGVRLENLSGRVTASTTNGAVNGRGLSGGLTAAVVNGGVQVDFAAIGGEVRIETTNGGVRLDVPTDAKATLEVQCVNGGIDVDGRLGVQTSEMSRRRLAGTLNGGGPRISADTVNGGIRIRARGENGRQPS
ncbi:MAG: DUF4097 family beta strand repeat protein [Acidobacteria bacterium]|nr:DUF4097 family beta strand repeat protein [Acidobacteriota bacterium]